MQIQIETETVEKAVNRCLEILDKEIGLAPLAAAFVLKTAQEHLEKLFNFKLNQTVLIPRCAIIGCGGFGQPYKKADGELAYTNFCENHQIPILKQTKLEEF